VPNGFEVHWQSVTVGASRNLPDDRIKNRRLQKPGVEVQEFHAGKLRKPELTGDKAVARD